MEKESFKIDKKLTQRLRRRKQVTGLTIAWQIEIAVRQYLDRLDRKDKK